MITDKGVAVPDDMAGALQADEAGLTAFEALRPDDQRIYVEWVKTPPSGRSASRGWPSTSAPTSVGPRRTTRRTRSATPDERGTARGVPRLDPMTV